MFDSLSHTILGHHPLFAGAALVFAALAAAVLIWFLLAKPTVNLQTKLLLLMGLGVLPIGAAMMGNVAGFEHTTTREFCGSCHVMTPYAESTLDLERGGLAAIHGQNEVFGKKNCYACHKDYGMFGAVTTKIGGFHHMTAYYSTYWRMPLEEAIPQLHIYVPYPNENCMQCHSTKLPGFREVDDHAGMLEQVRAGEVSCVSAGCHGPAHPFSKAARDAEGLEESAP
jgi:nitrate/TMAO reductase-like tetraheme cytochrome c subunit